MYSTFLSTAMWTSDSPEWVYGYALSVHELFPSSTATVVVVVVVFIAANNVLCAQNILNIKKFFNATAL